MKNRILMAILLPCVAVATIIAVWATTNFVPPLLGFIQKRTDASLELVTELGLEKCENSFNYLLDLRLEEDERMIGSLKRETLLEITSLSEQFEKIHLVVLDMNGAVISSSTQPQGASAMVMNQIDISGKIVQQTIFNNPARVVTFYFPFWRWYVVGYIFEEDYSAPLLMARRVIFGGTFAILLAIIATAGLTFYFRVNQPLKRIVQASGKVARGEFHKVATAGNDEIAQVAAAFNSMVSSLETGHQRLDETLSALRESEELYRVVTENSLSHILLIHKGEIVFANQRSLNDSGYSMPEILGRSALDLIHPDFQAEVRKLVRNRITDRRLIRPIECRYLTKSGEARWVELTVVPTTYQSEIVVLIQSADITQRKAAYDDQRRLETKLRQAQKMEAIGTLAGGIAHDFNNILSPIVGYSQLLMLDLPQGGLKHQYANSILTAGLRASELVNQILAFSRQSDQEKVLVEVQNILQEVLRLSRSIIPTSIEILQDIQDDCGSVQADPTQLHQVAMNLITNAYHAVDESSGKISLSLKEVILEDVEMLESSLEPGVYAMVSVSDNGTGISAEVMERIFDPYFTTKGKSKGTGLGLAIVYGIIKEHSGDIKVYSEPGEGTTFTVYLPVVTEPKVVDPEESREDLQKGTEHILLVDDEEPVLDIGREMLEKLGYKVSVFTNSMQALEAFTKHGETFDLVITDMTMPDLTGTELATKILAMKADMPIIMCTGLDRQVSKVKVEEIGVKWFMRKPFFIEELATAIRRVLGDGKD